MGAAKMGPEDEAVDALGGADSLEQYATYEDYLDSQISETDMYYLEDEDLARQLVELGYRGTGETLKRNEFEARKKAENQRHKAVSKRWQGPYWSSFPGKPRAERRTCPQR